MAVLDFFIVLALLSALMAAGFLINLYLYSRGALGNEENTITSFYPRKLEKRGKASDSVMRNYVRRLVFTMFFIVTVILLLCLLLFTGLLA
ncbi:MAG TPA: hypothetical protein VHZ51_07200 [Ktedonobacteraceae bacterium]|jgi:hypothetical protein|nr:hypothetical protein [Ktedonobacteraceae bacterium]